MADTPNDAAPAAITSASLVPAKNTEVLSDKIAPRAKERPDTVRVKPRKFYREDHVNVLDAGDEDRSMMTPDSGPYETTRMHATGLKACGLVDYVNAEDEDASIEDEAAAAGETVRVRRRRIGA